MKYLSDDCVWIMEPSGTEYHGYKQLKTFIEIAMSGRIHDKDKHKIEILNWFNNDENLCIEYTHGAISTGNYTMGIRKVNAGVLRYCITYHMREGKIDRVHEYIDATSWLFSCFMPIVLARLYKLTMKKLAKA